MFLIYPDDYDPWEMQEMYYYLPPGYIHNGKPYLVGYYDRAVPPVFEADPKLKDLTDEQLSWLNEMAKVSNQPLRVFMHNPTRELANKFTYLEFFT